VSKSLCNISFDCLAFFSPQRLTGATLLVFANKQDLPGALKAEEIKEVRKTSVAIIYTITERLQNFVLFSGVGARLNQKPPLANTMV
jgi:hypothetical protein